MSHKNPWVDKDPMLKEDPSVTEPQFVGVHP